MSEHNTLDFEVDVLPSTDATYNLGSENKRWKLNGKTVGAAMEKNVDTSISEGSSSANLPTSAAVAYFVEHKGYSSLDASVVGETLILE